MNPTKTDNENRRAIKQRELGKTIQDRMYDKRWSVQRLCEESGISRAIIYKTFYGQQINQTTLLAICQALELEVTITQPQEA